MVLLPRVALAFHLEATALLTSESQLITLITKENTARLPGYHLSNLFKRQHSLSKTREAKNWRICCKGSWKDGFPFKTLKVPSAFWQQFDAPGKKRKPLPCPFGQEPSTHLGHHLEAQGHPSQSQRKACACWHPTHPMAQHTFLLNHQLRLLSLNVNSYCLILQSKIITCLANPSIFPNPPQILESYYYKHTMLSKTIRKGETRSPGIM